MKVSIRNFLLINLLITMIIAIAATTIGNYYLDSKDIRNHLDTLLGQASFNLAALLGNDFHHRDLNNLQHGINQIPTHVKEAFANASSQYEKYQFQVWDHTGKLLLASIHAPKQRLSTIHTGFSDVIVKNVKWRTYTTYDKKLKLYIIVAEKYGEQDTLADRITSDDIYITLIIYPMAAILIWIIVGRGLASIRRVTDEVSHRVPNFLESVNANSVPKEIKPLVIELNKLFLRLHQALEREKRFAGDAAHELRTPLAASKTQAQVTLKANNEIEREKLLHNVVIAVDRCTHVVQQLLTLSRLAPQDTMISDTCALDLEKLVTEIVAQLVPLALDKDIDIELITDKKHPTIIQGNITAIGILIRNLVDNAIRYTPHKGKITIILTNPTGEKIYLKVIDNGPGIPAEFRARVFERFFRILGNKSTGSGLGLAIVQQIALLHKAELKLRTPETGKGLEVTISMIPFNSEE